MAFTTFLDAATCSAPTDPSYSLYPVLAEIQGCNVNALPLTDDWDPAARFRGSSMNDAGARLVCIVNPHAPTGLLVDADTIADIANELEACCWSTKPTSTSSIPRCATT